MKREHRTEKPLAYKPQLRQYIHINPDNIINPDQDIVANGTYTLGPVTNSVSKGGPLMSIYNDEGKVMGTITHNRLAILHSAYCHTRQVAPEILQELHATSFVHEVAKLTLRYQAGQSRGAERLPDQSGLPDEYMDALIQSMDIQCERFASPLNFNPAVKHYYSLHDRDRVFGANTDAYSTKWEGASEANPPHEAGAMEKAIRWAIFSAETSTSPTLTAFMLPKTDANAYQKWLTHPIIRQLGCIEREHISFKTSDYWKTGQPYKHHSKEDVTMFVVANQAGLDKFLHMQQLRQQVAHASLKHGKKSFILNDIAQLEPCDKVIDNELIRGLYEPKTFDHAAQAPGLPWGHDYVLSTEEDEEGRIRPQLKRYDPDSMVHTDGSHKKDINLTGSGVYGWKDGVEEHIRIRPSRSGPVHTINRAELIALLYALCHWQGQNDLVIATDSAFAMQSINEHLQNPEAHKYNKHKNLFQAIIKQLLTRAQRQQNTSIVKVKSHIQIRGN